MPEGGLGAVHVGQKRCMRVEGNDMPFAVGKMLVSDADIAAKGMKGKGMAVLHVYNDALWAYGGRRVPNDGLALTLALTLAPTLTLPLALTLDLALALTRCLTTASVWMRSSRRPRRRGCPGRPV